MTAFELPPSVGRIVAPGERQTVPSWLVDGVLASSGLTAIATVDPKLRTALGATALAALLTGQGEILGKAVAVPVGRAVALITARRSLDAYRAVDETGRLAVVHLQPRVPSDDTYWASLHEFIAQGKFRLVVVETVQDIDNGNPSPVPTVVLSELDCAVLALYRGNETKPGVGGEAVWNAANIKLWVSREGHVQPVDGTHLTEPWSIDLTSVREAKGGLSPDQDRVAKTAALAASVGTVQDSGAALVELCSNHSEQLNAIWGTAKLGAIMPTLGREQAVWNARFTGQPVTNSNGPGF